MANECMLTTTDNPYDPFEQFIQWSLFDIEKGYNSCERLNKIMEKNGVTAFGSLSQKELDDAMDQAIDEIIENDFANIYVKAFEGVSNDHKV